MKEYKTYIFDLDGTLLDSLEDLKNSTNHALRLFDMPEHSLEDIRKFVGNGVKKLMERAVPDGLDNPKFEEVYAVFREHYMKHNLDKTAPYPGIIELLSELKKKDKNIAVVSNKFYPATKSLVKHFFGDYIEVAIGEREDIRKKPAPDTVYEAFRQLGVTDEDAVYVGDSDVDVKTAANVGIPCVSVLWGFRDKDFLKSCGAETFITNPRELLNF